MYLQFLHIHGKQPMRRCRVCVPASVILPPASYNYCILIVSNQLMQRYRVCVPTSAPTYVTLPKNAVCNYYFRMPRLKGYSVHEVITMLENDENFWEANVYIHLCPPTDPNYSDGDSADEELGTIDNLSRNQLATEGEATVLRGPHKRERIGGYEETEDTLEDTCTSEGTTSSAGGRTCGLSWPVACRYRFAFTCEYSLAKSVEKKILVFEIRCVYLRLIDRQNQQHHRQT